MVLDRRCVVTGATGFVGRRLCGRLQSPRVLTRKPEAVPAEFSDSPCFRWDPLSELPPPTALDGCEAVFHLAGEPVAQGRWTASKKARIRDSRVLGTRNLVAGLAAMDEPPEVLVSASAVGYYGSCGNEALSETAPKADGFLADVCEEWESEATQAAKLGVRVVLIRIGLVLGREGGALARLLPLFRMAAGGRLGNGSQWVPWIHVSDLANLFVFSAEHPDLRGAVNGTAPSPVTNAAFTKALARAVGKPALFPAPAFGLRLALGEFASVLLASQRVLPKRATEAGFEFEYRTIAKALAQICGQSQ